MPQSRVGETSNTSGLGAFTLTGAPTGLRAFAAAYTPGGGVPIYYVAEGLDGSNAQTGQWEIGIGSLSGGGTLTRTTAVISSSGTGAFCSFSSASLRIFDAITPEAVNAMTAALIAVHAAAVDPHGDRAAAVAAIATHAAIASGVHGISAFAATLLDDTSNTAMRTTLGLGTAATASTAAFEPAGAAATAAASAVATHVAAGVSAHPLFRPRVETQATLTPSAGAIVVDLDPALPIYRVCTTAAALSVTTTNRVNDSRGCGLRITNSSGGSVALTWPAWTVLGAALPATLAAGKVLRVALVCNGTNEADVDASWSVQL